MPPEKQGECTPGCRTWATNQAAPTTPTGLAANASGTSQINLSWNAVTGATSYKLEAQAAGSNVWLSVYTGNATSFANTGLTANTQYSYRVSATNTAGTSAVSTAVSAKTNEAAPTTPTTPTGLAANATSTSQINVTWNAVSNAASYKLEVQAAGSSTWTTIYTGNATSFNNTGLASNTQYTYRVSAVNPGGASAVSNTISAKTLGTPPAVPTGLSINNGTATASTLDLSWKAVTGATSYVLEVQMNGKWETIYTGSGTSFTSTGLANNTSYNFRISAVNESGTSAFSSTVSGKTKNK